MVDLLPSTADLLISREYTTPDDVDLSAGTILTPIQLGDMQAEQKEKESSESRIDRSVDFASLLQGGGVKKEKEGDDDEVEKVSHSSHRSRSRSRSRDSHHNHHHHHDRHHDRHHHDRHHHDRHDKREDRHSDSTPASLPEYRYSVEDSHHENWVRVGLEVKIMNETLGNGMLYKKKGIITALIDEFTAKVKVIDSKVSIKIDQVSK